MNTNPFFIEFWYKDKHKLAEVKPCCEANNVYYYDIMINDQYQFTITPATNSDKGFSWRISLKNADKHVDEGLIKIIGDQIERHNL